MTEEEATLYALDMHEALPLDGALPGVILRVAGGWIYTLENRDGTANATFVPYPANRPLDALTVLEVRGYIAELKALAVSANQPLSPLSPKPEDHLYWKIAEKIEFLLGYRQT